MSKCASCQTCTCIDSTDFDKLNQHVQNTLRTRTLYNPHLFLTGACSLFPVYIYNLPVSQQRHHTCTACRRFLDTYGSLAVVEVGKVRSALWDENGVDALYYDAVKAMRIQVETASVSSVFHSDTRSIGNSKDEPWHHFNVHLPMFMECSINAQKLMAEQRSGFFLISSSLNRWRRTTVSTAYKLLSNEAVHRSNKFMPMMEWFVGLPAPYSSGLWLAVAKALPGFCHIASSPVGALMDDIEAGVGTDVAICKFNKIVSPTEYMRPKAPPKAGNVIQAAKLVEDLGIEDSLKRRYARIEEVQTLWLPRRTRAEQKAKDFGVFAGIEIKADTGRVSCSDPVGDVVRITFAKFRRDVMPTAVCMQAKIPIHGPFAALLTAECPDAKPILKWDRPEKRNPVSWYLDPHGSPASRWCLPAGKYVEVSGICESPQMWNSEDLYGLPSGVFLLLKGCVDTGCQASALFPEFLVSALNPVRSTIEKYSNEHAPSGAEAATACGLLIQASCTYSIEVRVRRAIEQTFVIDRLE